GKSRIFQGFRLMLQKDKDCKDPLRDPITIIFTPLLGLGDAQVLELNHREPDIAIFLNGNSSSNDLLRVSQGHYRVVYISPETSQTAAVGRALWWNPNFRHLICLVAVDEAHLVDEWYDISVLIDENLNRPELYYNIIQSHIGDKFRGGGSTPVDHVVEELDPATKKPHVVQGYFSDRTPGAKSRVYRAFLDGRCMIVCATEAFGMGMDIPDIDGVYNWGIPRSLSSLIQRFGRGARGKYRTATCTLILPQYCKDIIRPPHPESIDVPNDQSPEVQVSHDPDLYDFLDHYCLRKAVMEHLNGVDAEYTAITAGPCCSLCSQARYYNMYNQHDANSMGPRGYSGLAQTIPIQKKKKARYTRPFIRAIIIESLNEWRAEILDLLWKEKDPFAIEEMIATDEIIESIAKQAWMLVEDDQLPIPFLCAWGTFQRFRNFIPDKPVASVIVSSFHKGSEMWKDSQSKKKEKTLLSKQKNRLEAARGRPLQRGSLGQSSRSIGRRDSSQESVTSEVGMVDEEEEQLEDQNEAIDQAADV
ncbi:P-loop containing nucleoside triphosphate hydrolase protein, partial [Elaphomyces granulatus]